MTEKTIAHYNIRRELGRGGMGIVYEAEDTKLHRLVALKVLSPHLIASEDDRARFYREARSAAALNHPNIATVYAVDEVAGSDGEPSPYIAMEYIDGRTLRELIDEGPLKLDDAVRIGIDAANALGTAHKKDIVHRDVKSANLMITSDGAVKVLDFGLAKSAQSTMLTRTGSTLGTAAYMSPEQARTMDVDGRSDLWSLGVVLYEMVAGRLPFGAAYEQAVVYSIINSDPEPLTSVRTGVPMELERVVSKCLMKDPKLRYQHADDLVADLTTIQLGQTAMRTTTIAAAPQTHAERRRSWIIGLAGLLIGAIVGGSLAWLASDAGKAARQVAPPPVHRLTLKLPEHAPLEPVGAASLGVGHPALAISHDGRLLVYVAKIGDNKTQLYLRELDSGETRPLVGTEQAKSPFFSPDGNWIAFRQETRLMRVSTSGGSPIYVADTPEAIGGDWSSDGYIWSSARQGAELVRVHADGGNSDVIRIQASKTSTGVNLARAGEMPSMLPGNSHVLLTRTNRITVTSVADGVWTEILSQGSSAKYTPSGHLVFALPGRLMAAPFDLASLQVLSTPVPVVEGVRTEVVRRAAQYTFSQTGTLVYAPGAAADLARLVTVGIDGSKELLPFDPAHFGSFALSPDGKSLAINTYGVRTELWIYDLTRSRQTRIPDAAYCPLAWMPDGERLVHCRTEGDKVLTVATSREGASSQTLLVSDRNIMFYDVSGDGKYMATVGPETIDVFEFDDPDFSDPVVSVEEEAWGPVFSPDDKYLSYTSLENTGSEIYVVALDGSGKRWQVSDGGGEEALWSQDGKWLFYSNGSTWYRVPVSTQPVFTYGEPEVAFQGPYLNVPGFGYAVYPGGDRFIVVESVNPTHPISELIVVENWFQELERLAPTGQ